MGALAKARLFFSSQGTCALYLPAPSQERMRLRIIPPILGTSIPPEETVPSRCQLLCERGDRLRIFSGDLHVGTELGNACREFFCTLNRLRKAQIHKIEPYADHGQ